MGPGVRRDDARVSIFKQQRPSLRAQAEQSMEPHRKKEWIASAFARRASADAVVASAFARRRASADKRAPRNDECRHSFAISQRDTPEVCIKFPPSPNRGRREAGRPMRPIAACAIIVVERTRVSQVTPESPGTPRAMVYGLSRALPGDRALLPPSPARLGANLTPASGRQDHTFLPSASARFVKACIRVHRSPPRVDDVAQRPSEWDGMANHIV